MKIICKTGDPELAEVMVAKFRNDENLLAEFVDAKEVRSPREKKWVVIISTQFGCPVNCQMCDSGGFYKGDLSCDEMLRQVDHVVSLYPSETLRDCEKFKVQFARMGEPALNPAVLDALAELPSRFKTKNLIPCIATTAPEVSREWFEKLLNVKREFYTNKTFQLQMSINSTCERERDRLMPIKKMTFEEISYFGERFVEAGDRKISLNFALMQKLSLNVEVIADNFSPEKFCIKATPLNPTERSKDLQLRSLFDDAKISDDGAEFLSELADRGFDVILSVGDLNENKIGSNCGQSVRYLKKNYSVKVEKASDHLSNRFKYSL